MTIQIIEANDMIKKHLMKGRNRKCPIDVSFDYTSDHNVIYCEELPILDVSQETIKEVCDKYDIDCIGIKTKQLTKEGAYVGVFLEKDSFKIICTIKIRSTRSNADLKKLIAIIRNRIAEIRESLMYELNYDIA